MKQAHRLFNLLLPFKIYEELKVLSTKSERSIASIVREGIEHVLITQNCKSRKNEKR